MSNLTQKRVILATVRVQVVMRRNSWQQELEAAGHIVSAIRKGRAMKDCANFLPYAVQGPSPRNDAIFHYSGSSSSAALIKTIPHSCV